MRRRLIVRGQHDTLRTLCCIATLAVVCRCAAAPPNSKFDSVVLVEVVDDVVERIPCRELGKRPGPFGLDCSVYEIDAACDALGNRGVFDGIEGAPIVGASGDVVGAVASQMFDHGAVVSCFTKEEIRRLWINARSWIDSAPAKSALESGRSVSVETGVELGETVALLSWWGDVPCSPVAIGTVMDIDGRDLLLRDGDQIGSPEERGEQVLAIARVRTIAFGATGRGAARVFQVGEPVGAVLYQGGIGRYGSLGRLPR